MNNNNNNNLEIVSYDPKAKKSDGRKKNAVGKHVSKGSWTQNRILALLSAYRNHRPYGVAHGKKTGQWNLVTEAVNSKSTDVTSLGKQSVKEKLDELMRQYEPTFSEYEVNRASGSNKHIPLFEREAHKTYEVVR